MPAKQKTKSRSKKRKAEPSEDAKTAEPVLPPKRQKRSKSLKILQAQPIANATGSDNEDKEEKDAETAANEAQVKARTFRTLPLMDDIRSQKIWKIIDEIRGKHRAMAAVLAMQIVCRHEFYSKAEWSGLSSSSWKITGKLNSLRKLMKGPPHRPRIAAINLPEDCYPNRSVMTMLISDVQNERLLAFLWEMYSLSELDALSCKGQWNNQTPAALMFEYYALRPARPVVIRRLEQELTPELIQVTYSDGAAMLAHHALHNRHFEVLDLLLDRGLSTTIPVAKSSIWVPKFSEYEPLLVSVVKEARCENQRPFGLSSDGQVLTLLDRVLDAKLENVREPFGVLGALKESSEFKNKRERTPLTWTDDDCNFRAGKVFNRRQTDFGADVKSYNEAKDEQGRHRASLMWALHHLIYDETRREFTGRLFGRILKSVFGHSSENHTQVPTVFTLQNLLDFMQLSYSSSGSASGNDQHAHLMAVIDVLEELNLTHMYNLAGDTHWRRDTPFTYAVSSGPQYYDVVRRMLGHHSREFLDKHVKPWHTGPKTQTRADPSVFVHSEYAGVFSTTLSSVVEYSETTWRTLGMFLDLWEEGSRRDPLWPTLEQRRVVEQIITDRRTRLKTRTSAMSPLQAAYVEPILQPITTLALVFAAGWNIEDLRAELQTLPGAQFVRNQRIAEKIKMLKAEEQKRLVEAANVSHLQKDVASKLVETQRASDELLPPSVQAGKMTLVMDLDETMVSTYMGASEELSRIADFAVCPEIDKLSGWQDQTPDDQKYADMDSALAAADQSTTRINLYCELRPVFLRPHLRHFLREVSKIVELVFWTRASKAYADAVLRRIDPEGTIFPMELRLYSHHCKGCAKDVGRLGRPLDRTILLDDDEFHRPLQPRNQICIRKWDVSSVEQFEKIKNERCLLDTLELLKTLVSVSDMSNGPPSNPLGGIVYGGSMTMDVLPKKINILTITDDEKHGFFKYCSNGDKVVPSLLIHQPAMQKHIRQISINSMAPFYSFDWSDCAIEAIQQITGCTKTDIVSVDVLFYKNVPTSIIFAIRLRQIPSKRLDSKSSFQWLPVNVQPQKTIAVETIDEYLAQRRALYPLPINKH